MRSVKDFFLTRTLDFIMKYIVMKLWLSLSPEYTFGILVKILGLDLKFIIKNNFFRFCVFRRWHKDLELHNEVPSYNQQHIERWCQLETCKYESNQYQDRHYYFLEPSSNYLYMSDKCWKSTRTDRRLELKLRYK